MPHNSLKTYMHKGLLCGRSRRPGIAVIQQRSATLHYNCMPRGMNILASWIVPDNMAEDRFGGGVVLGWETEAYGKECDGPQDRKPANDYAVACSVRHNGEEPWVFFKLDDPPRRTLLDTRMLTQSAPKEPQDNESEEEKDR